MFFETGVQINILITIVMTQGICWKAENDGLTPSKAEPRANLG